MPVYLFAALCLTACLVGGCVLWPHRRGGALLAGFVLSPFALLGAAFVPAYWQPDHVFTIVRGVVEHLSRSYLSTLTEEIENTSPIFVEAHCTPRRRARCAERRRVSLDSSRCNQRQERL